MVRRLGGFWHWTAIYDGANRTEAAEIGGVTLQIIRDWVMRFNVLGPNGLIALQCRPLVVQIK